MKSFSFSGSGTLAIGLALALSACLKSPSETAAPQEHPGPDGFKDPREKTGYYLWEGVSHPISYIEVDGEAMTGGDIILDRRLLSDVPHPLTKRGATVEGNSLWPSRFINYFIDPAFSAVDRDTIIWGMNEIRNRTNIKFTLLAARPTGTTFTTFIEIVRSTTSRSAVGYPGINQAARVNFRPGHGRLALMHEVGHRLGFWHEHQRPDRDLYLNMYPRNHCRDPLIARIDTRAVTTHCIGSWGVDMNITGTSRAVGPLDFESIMMYHTAAQGLRDAANTLLTQPAANSPFAGPDFVLPARAVGFAYSTMLRRGFTYPTDPRSFTWTPGGAQGTLSAQDVANWNSVYPSSTIAIGWIDRGGGCTGVRGYISQDDEDTQNGTAARVWFGFNSPPPAGHNYNTPSGIYRNGQETVIRFCRENHAELPVLRNDYAVLRMSVDCPRNSYAFSRHSDNENTNNGNNNSGNIYPSSQTTSGQWLGSTTLSFCFVPGDGDVNPAPQPSPPWRNNRQAAFSRGNFEDSTGCNEYHGHVQDDEDTNNAFRNRDPYTYSEAAAPYAQRIRTLFNNSVTETHYMWNACR